MQITFHGHSFLELELEQSSVLIDPFVSENPRCDIALEELLKKNISHIVLTHGHHDHLGDTIAIAQATKASVVAMVELCDWIERQGVDALQLEAYNLGGVYRSDGWSVSFVKAQHSSSTPDGEYAGLATGLIFDINGYRIYNAGDTNLFSDMSLVKDIDCAFLPIGGRFTMDCEEALQATALIQPKIVVPIHYNTWSKIKADDMYFAQQVMLKQYAIPKVLRPGQYIVF